MALDHWCSTFYTEVNDAAAASGSVHSLTLQLWLFSESEWICTYIWHSEWPQESGGSDPVQHSDTCLHPPCWPAAGGVGQYWRINDVHLCTRWMLVWLSDCRWCYMWEWRYLPPSLSQEPPPGDLRTGETHCGELTLAGWRFNCSLEYFL